MLVQILKCANFELNWEYLPPNFMKVKIVQNINTLWGYTRSNGLMSLFREYLFNFHDTITLFEIKGNISKKI